MWGCDYPATASFDTDENKLKHYTILFNTFFFMQVFNTLNCRKMGSQELNIFTNFFNNPMYFLVIVGECIMQVILVNVFGKFFRCYPLTGQEHAACILIAMVVLIVSTALKLTPPSWVDKIPIKMDESKKIGDDDLVMNYFNKGVGAAKPSKKELLLYGDDQA